MHFSKTPHGVAYSQRADICVYEGKIAVYFALKYIVGRRTCPSDIVTHNRGRIESKDRAVSVVSQLLESLLLDYPN